MKFNKIFFVILFPIAMGACNSDSGNSSDPIVGGLPNGATLTPVTGNNVMNFTVNGSTCSAGSYVNKPCVSVTICNVDRSVCQTVNDLLLDTGSYGLRVFSSAIPNLTLTPVAAKQGGALTECAKFGGGTSTWGPIEQASVTLGNEPAVTVPIQVINESFGSVPNSCTNPYASVSAAGFNGILGIGLFAEDCGSSCVWNSVAVPNTNNGIYFSCTGGNTGSGTGSVSCTGGSTTSMSNQVQNPVSSLPTDNNGVILELPSISTSGTSNVNGYLIFGIGTESNNQPTAVTRLSADTDANLVTQYNGANYSGFLDSGSNGLFFTAPTGTMPECSGYSWLCPTSTQTLNLVNVGSDGNNSVSTTVYVANANTLFDSGNAALNDLGGYSNGMFDFGLPFYFGRNVYLVIDGKTSTALGTGPAWAY
jgi:hypothetical protein